MKRNTPNHPKMRELAAVLSVPLWGAVGIMESLWHYAAEYTPRGDIGRLSDATIATAIDWRKKPAVLISALTDSRCQWLDNDDDFRLIVHDWPDHCEYEVTRKLLRTEQDFLPIYGRSVRSKVRKFTDVGSEDVQPDPNKSAHVRASREAKAKAIGSEESNSETSLLELSLGVSGWNERLEHVAFEIHKRHPSHRKCSLKVATEKLTTICRAVPESERVACLDYINTQHSKHCISTAWTKESGEYAKSLEAWLNPAKRLWENEPLMPGFNGSGSDKPSLYREATDD